jgi:superfamily II DNA or RNA helicase
VAVPDQRCTANALHRIRDTRNVSRKLRNCRRARYFRCGPHGPGSLSGAGEEPSSIVDGQEVNEFALKHGITLVEGDLIAARWVANQIAVERAVGKTGAKRVITFHSRVSSAKEFSSDGTHGIRQYLPAFSVFHVNGDQKSSERKQLIRSFRDASEGLITNARCLTEGIDVPAVDMVAFIDPRRSRVDIAQATGRAMRKPPGLSKEVGYVVVPLFLDTRSGETLEEALETVRV